MPSTSVQLKEPIPTSGGLIGSFYAGKIAEDKNLSSCPACAEAFAAKAKFCGDCGSPTTHNSSPNNHNLNHQVLSRSDSSNHNLSIPYLNEQRAKVVGMPAFARVSPQLRKPVPAELKKEYGKVSCLLAREQFFLLVHWLIFVVTNVIGLLCAFKAYNGLLADEMTRLVVASIPVLCINSVAFGCLVPIKGTRQEIARLKERRTYMHYQIEYVNLA